MDHTTARRPMTAALALTTAAAIAFATTTAGPSVDEASHFTAPRVSVEAVQLAAVPLALQQVWDIATGKDSTFPLPAGSNPVAPITEQVLRTVATYGTQLLTGQGGKIPGEISAQVQKLQSALSTVGNLLVDAVAIVPVVLVSLAFNTALGIAGLGQSADALPFLARVWINAAILPPLKWVYNAFAIRNTIAMALQPQQPDPAAAGVAVPPESTARNVDSKPARVRASSGIRPSARAAAPPAATLSKKTASPSSARSTAATGSTGSTPNAISVGKKHNPNSHTAGARNSA
jgi:hypothetical protein